jgi:hypothetical protein
MLPHAPQVTAAGHFKLGGNGDLHIEGRLIAGGVVVGKPGHRADWFAEYGGSAVGGGFPAIVAAIRIDVGDRLAVILDRHLETAVDGLRRLNDQLVVASREISCVSVDPHLVDGEALQVEARVIASLFRCPSDGQHDSRAPVTVGYGH